MEYSSQVGRKWIGNVPGMQFDKPWGSLRRKRCTRSGNKVWLLRITAVGEIIVWNEICLKTSHRGDKTIQKSSTASLTERERERERLRKGQRKLKGWNTWYVPLILSSLNSTWKEKLSHKRKNNLGCLRDKLLSTLVWVLFFYFFQITWPSRIHLSCWNTVSVRVIGDCLLGLENWKWSNKPPVPKAVDKRTETSVNISSQRMPEN